MHAFQQHAETGAPVTGVPLAMGLAAEIVKSCDELVKQHEMAKVLGLKSTTLANALQEASLGLDGLKLQECADEVTGALKKVLKCTQKWQKQNAIARWLRRAEIQKDLEKCDLQLDNVIKTFEPKIPAGGTHQFETIRELLLKISDDHQQMQKLILSQKSKKPHPMTTILPPDKVLDGTVRKLYDLPVVGGSNSDIWCGIWLEEEKVALKGLRNAKVDDPNAQKRLAREIGVWSKLNNNRVVNFYGIATDLGADIFMVSPWLENGNVLEYIKAHPEADVFELICGAAEGLKYLHSESVIHGNLKCSKVLITASGEACISGFGMSRVIEDNNESSFYLSGLIGSVRWVAPEILDGTTESASSDIYSFGMVILELLTGAPPYFEYRSDTAVIRALMKGAQPKRPIERVWFSDKLWALTQRCWSIEPGSRPTMEVVLTELREM